MKNRNSITTKVILILFLSITLTTTLSGILSYYIERKKIVETMDENITRITDSLVFNLVNPIWNFDETSIQSIIDLELKNNILTTVILKNDDYSLWLIRSKNLNKEIINYVQNKQSEDSFYKIIKKDIYYENELIAKIEFYFNNSLLQDRLTSSILTIFVQTMLVTLITILLIFTSLKNSLLNPVIKINEVVERFANKDFQARTDFKSKDEIGHLAQSFNNMANTIQLYTETMESVIEERTKELVKSEKMASLGGLVAGIAHEINTPVGISVTASSHLSKKTSDFTDLYKNNQMKRSDLDSYLEVAKESTDIIMTNLEKASQLIQSFKQVAVDQSSEEKRTFKIKEYIEDVLTSLRPKLRKYNHRIEIESAEEIEIDSYPGAFSQIVSNLVINSLIHGYDEGQSGNIKFILNKEKINVVLIYSDDGKGIPKENLNRIFEPFFTTKRNNGGSGLGMHIIYNIVTQKLFGTIECDSEIGKGVKFTIRIPI